MSARNHECVVKHNVSYAILVTATKFVSLGTGLGVLGTCRLMLIITSAWLVNLPESPHFASRARHSGPLLVGAWAVFETKSGPDGGNDCTWVYCTTVLLNLN
jgi:hypothetical protein